MDFRNLQPHQAEFDSTHTPLDCYVSINGPKRVGVSGQCSHPNDHRAYQVVNIPTVYSLDSFSSTFFEIFDLMLH